MAHDAKLLLKSYSDMLLIRRFEERAGQAYTMGLIGGFCHLYIGQEAVVVGMQNVISSHDYTITSYRAHGHILAAGTDPNYVMAELFGKSTGSSKGKGGSMHLFDKERGFFGGHGIVGAQVSLGTGISFACKYLENNSLSVVYFGDGAINQGQVYESFNMAALWKLPVIYVIENNEYAMGTSVKRASAIDNLYTRGQMCSIPGFQVNGMDLFAVEKAGRDAVEHVRSGQGPVILEMKTYRYRGHSVSDPAKYRTKEELEDYRENKDPIINLKKYLLSERLSNEGELKDIEKQIKTQVEKSFEFAKNSPEPIESELFTEILFSEEGR